MILTQLENKLVHTFSLFVSVFVLDTRQRIQGLVTNRNFNSQLVSSSQFVNVRNASFGRIAVCVYVCVCVCVRVYIFIIILILIGLRGPLTLRRRRGPSGLRPGMACTEHSTKCHTVTQTNKSNREEKGGRDREREKILDRGKGKEGERLEGIFFFFFGLKVMGMRPFCKDDHGGIRRRGGKRSKCCSIKIKNYSLNSKLKWTAAATRKKKKL